MTTSAVCEENKKRNELEDFLKSRKIIIVHPEQHIVAKIVKNLEKTK
jgi:hypothetical protein